MKTCWVVSHCPTGTRSNTRERRTHAVRCENVETFDQVGRRVAACGLVPDVRWGCDLHAKNKCSNCVRALRRSSRGGTAQEEQN